MSAMKETLTRRDAPIPDLETLFPEDYVRLGSPFSTILEVVLAIKYEYDVHHVFAFGSSTLPIIAILMTTSCPVFVYHDVSTPLTKIRSFQETLCKSYGRKFRIIQGGPKDHGKDSVVVYVTNDPGRRSKHADAVADGNGILYVVNEEKIPIHDEKDAKGEMVRESIHTIRKRLGAPPPTPEAIERLERYVKGGDTTSEEDVDVTDLKQHLKALAGCEGAQGNVLISTVGLSTLAAFVMAALEKGEYNIDVLMCSTAYGGSSQQTDILCKNCNNGDVSIAKHKYDIQGNLPVLGAIETKLRQMRDGPKKSITVVEIEYPTNPDMKDCDLERLRTTLQDYSSATSTTVVVLLDTTFSPPSQAAKAFGKEIPVIVWTSLSKSVSGGKTTGGSLVANAHPVAQDLLRRAENHLNIFDTASKPCQLRILNDMHTRCEERVRKAHAVAVKTSRHLEDVVRECSGRTMLVNFVTTSQINKGVTPATFSFNLPVPAHLTNRPRHIASLAQDFVDRLVEKVPTIAKPCVSFGQDNTRVYVTVPATSTQGVISEEDKAKQAVGGVQLVRFSFPPELDVAAWKDAVEATVREVYEESTWPPSRTRKWGTRSKIIALTGVAVLLGAGALWYCGRKSARKN